MNYTQLIIVLALVAIAGLSFWKVIPTENLDLIETITTAFIAYLTGYVSGKYGGKDEKDNLINSKPPVV